MLKRRAYRRIMGLESRDGETLADCHGYIVLADDGLLGTVEEPAFGGPDSSQPGYLVVRAPSHGLTRRVFVPASMVCRLDVDDELVYVQGRVWELSRLPKPLPAEGGSAPTA
jgi:hypothetical protein